jgi:hypothetical protein
MHSSNKHVPYTTSHTIVTKASVCDAPHHTRLILHQWCVKRLIAHVWLVTDRDEKWRPIPAYPTLSMVYIWTSSAITTPVNSHLASFRSATRNITWSARQKQDLLGGLGPCNADGLPGGPAALAHESLGGRTPVILAHHRPPPWPMPAVWSPARRYTYVPNC